MNYIRIMNLKSWLTVLLIFLLIAACGNSDDEPSEPPLAEDLGETYFFLREGKYREYDVFEIRYFAVDLSDTFNYQIREEVKEPFISASGDSAFILNRFRRATEDEEWELDSVWTARIEDQRAVSVENNIPFVKMVFPATTTRSWDGNLLNARPVRLQRYRNFAEPFTVGFNTFLRTAVVEMSNATDSITFRDIRVEVYADSVGLVEKNYDVVTLCTRPECLGQNIVQVGRVYQEKIIAHGFVDEED